MPKTRYGVDILFVIIGAFYAFTGKVSIFVAFFAASLLHELAHQAAAVRRGYARGSIRLAPYGAALSDSGKIMSVSSDVVISSAGVFFNACMLLFLLALWWVFPELYSHTLTFFTANAAIALFNILPAYPLDGARVILALTGHDKRVLNILKGVSCALGAAMAALGIISAGYRLNPTLIITGAFLIFGSLSENERDRYVSVLKSLPFLKDAAAPIEKRRFVVNSGMKLKTLVRKTKRDSLSDFELFLDGKRLLITEKILGEMIAEYGLDATLGEILLLSCGGKTKSGAKS